MSKVDEKIVELLEVALEEGDNNVAVIMYALKGAKHMNHEGLLAKKVADIVKDTMMPLAEQIKAQLN